MSEYVQLHTVTNDINNVYIIYIIYIICYSMQLFTLKNFLMREIKNMRKVCQGGTRWLVQWHSQYKVSSTACTGISSNNNKLLRCLQSAPVTPA